MAAGGGGGRPPGPDPALEPYVQTRIFKIIVIGDSNVGKTCLTFRFCGGTFPGKTEATIGVDFREKTVEIEGERIKVGPAAAPGWLTPAPVGPALSSVSPALSLLGPAGSPSSDGSRSPSLPLAKPLVGAFPFIPVGGREQGQGRIFIPVLQRCPWTSPCCLVTISGAGLSLQRSEVMARGESLATLSMGTAGSSQHWGGSNSGHWTSRGSELQRDGGQSSVPQPVGLGRQRAVGWQQPRWEAESCHTPEAMVLEPAPSCTWSCHCSRINLLVKALVTPGTNDQPRPGELWLVCQNKSATGGKASRSRVCGGAWSAQMWHRHPQPLRLVLEGQTSLLY